MWRVGAGITTRIAGPLKRPLNPRATQTYRKPSAFFALIEYMLGRSTRSAWLFWPMDVALSPAPAFVFGFGLEVVAFCHEEEAA